MEPVRCVVRRARSAGWWGTSPRLSSSLARRLQRPCNDPDTVLFACSHASGALAMRYQRRWSCQTRASALSFSGEDVGASGDCEHPWNRHVHFRSRVDPASSGLFLAPYAWHRSSRLVPQIVPGKSCSWTGSQPTDKAAAAGMKHLVSLRRRGWMRGGEPHGQAAPGCRAALV